MPGHYATDCWGAGAAGGRKGSNGKGKGKGKSDGKASFTGKCKYCQIAGHEKAGCRKRRSKMRQHHSGCYG
eukprot:9999504-Heterocapsa_arctica.AAC.1